MEIIAYNIKWKHPDFNEESIGPILIHTYNDKLYTKVEAEKVCKKFNESSKVIHSVI